MDLDQIISSVSINLRAVQRKGKGGRKYNTII